MQNKTSIQVDPGSRTWKICMDMWVWVKLNRQGTANTSSRSLMSIESGVRLKQAPGCASCLCWGHRCAFGRIHGPGECNKTHLNQWSLFQINPTSKGHLWLEDAQTSHEGVHMEMLWGVLESPRSALKTKNATWIGPLVLWEATWSSCWEHFVLFTRAIYFPMFV